MNTGLTPPPWLRKNPVFQSVRGFFWFVFVLFNPGPPSFQGHWGGICSIYLIYVCVCMFSHICLCGLTPCEILNLVLMLSLWFMVFWEQLIQFFLGCLFDMHCKKKWEFFLVTLQLPFYWWISLSFIVTCEYHCRLTASFVSRCLLQNGGRKVSIFIKTMTVFHSLWPSGEGNFWSKRKWGFKKIYIYICMYIAEKVKGKTN